MSRTTIGVSMGALVALVAAVLVFVVPANAATSPTARLKDGIVTVTGTPARDVISITLDADRLSVDFGSDGRVDAQFPMSRVQQLSVLAGEGDDGVTVTGTGVGTVPITISGGAGNDGGGVVSFADLQLAGVAPVTILGGDGNDNFTAFAPGPVTVDAGAGDDLVAGGESTQETISLSDGNDKYVSDFSNLVIANRNDSVDGGSGQDTMEVRGSLKSETVSLSEKAGHLIFNHPDGQIDADNIEDVTWFGFGSVDESGFGDGVTVNDLSGTDVVNFTPNFSSQFDPTAPNDSFDFLAVIGTPGDDDITVSGSGANITVAGLTPTITPVLLNSNDFLEIFTLDGHDKVDSHDLQRGLVQLQVF